MPVNGSHQLFVVFLFTNLWDAQKNTILINAIQFSETNFTTTTGSLYQGWFIFNSFACGWSLWISLAVKSILLLLKWFKNPLKVLNPDGYQYTWDNNRLWRKNRSQNEGSPCIGTDLNRNSDFAWGTEGASSNPCSDTFRFFRNKKILSFLKPFNFIFEIYSYLVKFIL